MEHYCKNCKHDGNNVCEFTGARHGTGITCPSFKQKENEMFKVGDKVRLVANGVSGVVRYVHHAYNGYDVSFAGGKVRYFKGQDLELVEAPTEVKPDRTFVGHPEGVLEVKEQPLAEYVAEAQSTTANSIRTFNSGATMTLERFDTLVDYIVEKRIKAVMCAKSAEYAEGTNKLHNFDRAGEMRDITPMEALRGMKLKHEVSIQDMLDGLAKGKIYSRERWEEKFTDNINYQILQWAILARDNGWDQPTVDRTALAEGVTQ